jgi:hypothetical protein
LPTISVNGWTDDRDNSLNGMVHRAQAERNRNPQEVASPGGFVTPWTHLLICLLAVYHMPGLISSLPANSFFILAAAGNQETRQGRGRSGRPGRSLRPLRPVRWRDIRGNQQGGQLAAMAAGNQDTGPVDVLRRLSDGQASPLTYKGLRGEPLPPVLCVSLGYTLIVRF